MTASLQVGISTSALVDIMVDPDGIDWSLMDISSADAGRVQDANATMYKNRIGQKRKLHLTWNNPTVEQSASILQAFNPEYFFVRYLDPMSGSVETREFYTGDRDAPFRMVMVEDRTGRRSYMKTLSFDIIER